MVPSWANSPRAKTSLPSMISWSSSTDGWEGIGMSGRSPTNWLKLDVQRYDGIGIAVESFSTYSAKRIRKKVLSVHDCTMT